MRLGVLSMLLPLSCGTPAGVDPADAPEPRPVTAAPVEEGVVVRRVRAAGTIAGKKEARLSFKVGGVVARMRVKEGERVKRGQVLAELDQEEIEAQVAQAARALEKAERDRVRMENLYASKVATLEQYQDATTGHDVARESWRVAEFNRRHATITAPARGRVLGSFAEEGELVAPGTPILQVSSEEGGVVVKAHFSERDVAELEIGDPSDIRVGAYPERSFKGRVVEIAGAASPLTGTFSVEIAVDGVSVPLRSGMSARVDIQPKSGAKVRRVPVEAFFEGERDGGWVYTVTADGHARRVAVGTSFIDGHTVAVQSGLDRVDRVLVDGATFVRDGDPVTVVTEMSHVDR